MQYEENWVLSAVQGRQSIWKQLLSMVYASPPSVTELVGELVGELPMEH